MKNRGHRLGSISKALETYPNRNHLESMQVLNNMSVIFDDQDQFDDAIYRYRRVQATTVA